MARSPKPMTVSALQEAVELYRNATPEQQREAMRILREATSDYDIEEAA